MIAVSGRLVLFRAFQGFLMHGLLKARGLILVPIYTRLLGPEGLGIVTLAGVLCGLLSPLLILGLHTGLSIQLVHLRGRVVIARAYRTVIKFAGVVSLFGSSLVVVSLLLPRCPAFLQALQPYAGALGGLLLVTSLRDLALVVPQLRQQTLYLTILNVSMDYGGAFLGIFLVWQGFGPSGIFWATCLAVGTGVTLTLIRTDNELGHYPGLDRAFLSSALTVGLPVLPIGLGQWALQSLDNLFLMVYHGKSTVGIYGVAYSMASVVLLILSALNLIYFPTSVTLWQEGPERYQAFLRRSFQLVILALGLFVSGACLLSGWSVMWLAGPRYAPAITVLPLIVASYAAFTVMQLLQFIPVVIERRTGTIAGCYLMTCLVNVGLNFLLIPRWSLMGAGVATFTSYIVGIFLMGILALRALPTFHWWQPIAASLLPMALTTFVALVVPVKSSASLGMAILSGLLLTLFYLGIARITGAFKPSDIRLFRSLVQREADPKI